MRVISGTARGTRLALLKGADIRPTLDRVKESLFNQVGPDLTGAVFLDLFAGTGSIGIEALSRGAERVVFVENDPQAQRLIHENLQTCRMGHHTGDSGGANWVLLKSDALRALETLQEKNYRFDLVYLDPPFQSDLYEETLSTLADSGLLAGEGLVVVEHYHKLPLNDNYGKLTRIKERRLGDTRLSFFALS